MGRNERTAWGTTGPRLLDRVRDAIRLRHYSYRTEQSYVAWIRRFIFFHNKRHPETMGANEVREFLTFLAVRRKIAPATQNQALCALVFLYCQVLQTELDWIDGFARAKRMPRFPVVLTRGEVQKVLSLINGRHYLLAQLLYGSGLRLMEALRLRVKDLDLDRLARILHKTGAACAFEYLFEGVSRRTSFNR